MPAPLLSKLSESFPLAAKTLPVIVISLLARWIHNYITKTRTNLPIRPWKLPLIGNLHQLALIDRSRMGMTEMFHEWSEKLGTDILLLDLAGVRLVILDTYEAAVDVLVKNGNDALQRPQLPLIQLQGLEQHFALVPYGDTWRAYNRLFHQIHNLPAFSSHFQRCMTQSKNIFLLQLLNQPDEFAKNIRHLIARTLLAAFYGIDIKTHNDPYVGLMEGPIAETARILMGAPGLVNMFPMLKNLPSRFPGMGWLNEIPRWKRNAKEMVDVPWNKGKTLALKNNTMSFLSRCLSNLESDTVKDKTKEESIMKWVAGSMYSAGVDTTSAGLTAFILAMALYPEVQRKAQEELDVSAKPGHLPTFEDAENFPYITAVVQEVLRWNPIPPTGAVRESERQIIYKGYCIPAGSLIVMNVWAMMYNETVFPNPRAFNPGRFLLNGKLNPDVPNPANMTFGYGKRMCPGRPIAVQILWDTIAAILSLYDIRPGTNEDGTPNIPSGQFTSGLIREPKPFKCTIEARSVEAKKLIIVLGESVSLDNDI